MDEKPGFGRTDEELATLPLNFRPDLMRRPGGADLRRRQRHRPGARATGSRGSARRVALCGRRIERLERTAEGLRRLGAEVLVEAASIRDPDDVARLQERVWARFGTLDVLVNNAGGQFPQAAIDYSVEGLERRDRHQPQRHLVHDAGRGAALARRRARRRRRQRGGGGLARHAGGRAYLRGARRRDLPVEDACRSNGRRSASASTAWRRASSRRRAWTSIRRRRAARCRAPT